jgi:hypothetical protein
MRGLAREISAAYDWWEENHPKQEKHEAICSTYVYSNGITFCHEKQSS